MSEYKSVCKMNSRQSACGLPCVLVLRQSDWTTSVSSGSSLTNRELSTTMT